MSFKDEIETLTGVPMGQNAFTITVLHWPDLPLKKKKLSRGTRPTRSKKDQMLTSLDSDEERAAKRLAARLAREAAITAQKPQGAFNTPIATRAESDRTNSIKGKL